MTVVGGECIVELEPPPSRALVLPCEILDKYPKHVVDYLNICSEFYDHMCEGASI